MMMSGLKSRISCTCLSVWPPPNGDHRAAQPLGAVVGAEAAGEQAVAVGDMHVVAGAAAGGADASAPSGSPRLSMSFLV